MSFIFLLLLLLLFPKTSAPSFACLYFHFFKLLSLILQILNFFHYLHFLLYLSISLNCMTSHLLQIWSLWHIIYKVFFHAWIF